MNDDRIDDAEVDAILGAPVPVAPPRALRPPAYQEFDRGNRNITAEVRTHRGVDRIFLQTPFHLKDAVKELPGRRWHGKDNPPVKMWSIAASPASAGALVDRFPNLTIQGCQKFKALVKSHRGAVEARQFATAEDLPEIPTLPVCGCPEPDRGPEGRAFICLRCDLPLPSWMHQRQAFEVARAHEGYLLQMGMGTGKSRVAVALADDMAAERVVIIATDKAIKVWPKQLDVWSARTWEVAWHGGINQRTGRPLKSASMKDRVRVAQDTFSTANSMGNPAAIVVNYAAAWQEPLRSYLLSLQPDLLVLDESHNEKAPGGRWAQFCHMLSRKARRRLLLTGTAMPHSKLDIYAQARCVDEGIFGTSYAQFRARYAVMGGYEDKQVVGFQNEEEFEQKLSTFMYVVGEDVLDLPEYHHLEKEVELSGEAARAYAQMDEEFTADVEGGRVEASNALSRLLRLSQITSGHLPVENPCGTCEGLGYLIEPTPANPEDPMQVQCPNHDCQDGMVGSTVLVGTDKRDRVREWLGELPQDEPVVMVVRFRHDLTMVRELAEELGRPYGEVSGRRDDLGEGATYPEDVTLLAVQIQSGAEGIDLTRARYMGIISTGFDNGKYRQVLKRTHRPGQKRTTIYVHFLANDSVDWAEYKALDGRESVIATVLAGVKQRGTTKAKEDDTLEPAA